MTSVDPNFSNDARTLWGWTDDDDLSPSPMPRMPKMACFRCPHEEHLGECGIDIVVQSVGTTCGCFSVPRRASA